MDKGTYSVRIVRAQSYEDKADLLADKLCGKKCRSCGKRDCPDDGTINHTVQQLMARLSAKINDDSPVFERMIMSKSQLAAYEELKCTQYKNK
jgi:hypothetical protein